MTPLTLFILGHGNRTGAELITLLMSAGITCLVDVRAQPQSNRHPQFGEDALRQQLNPHGIVYHWGGRQLGGFRTPRPDSPHTALRAEGLRGFADHMETDGFQIGIRQLLKLAAKSPVAMLCAEALPENCHRSLIADNLTLKGIRVMHLIEPGASHEHQLHPNARTESGRLIYDRMEQQGLRLN